MALKRQIVESIARSIIVGGTIHEKRYSYFMLNNFRLIGTSSRTLAGRSRGTPGAGRPLTKP
jgi:hypothetical protein